MKIITVKDFFQGMENLYNPRGVTSFEVEKVYNLWPAKKAELAWLVKKLKEWEKKMKETQIKVLNASICESTDGNQDGLFRASLFMLGGLEKNCNLLPEVKETLISSLRENLATMVLKDFPLFEGEEIFFASNIPVHVHIERLWEGHPAAYCYTEEDIISIYKKDGLKEQIENLFLEQGMAMEIINISTKEKLPDYQLRLTFIFKKDVSGSAVLGLCYKGLNELFEKHGWPICEPLLY